MRFRDIPKFTRSAGYMVHVTLDALVRHYQNYVDHYGLDVSPDFQRGNVWTRQQQVRFMEYFLKGGTSGLDIYCNSPTWQHGDLSPENKETWFVLVDGKQRIEAALAFLNNEYPIFDGAYFRDFEDNPRLAQGTFRWHVNDLKTREEVLQWYLDLNTGGTVHSDDELDKVRAFLKDGTDYVKPSTEEIRANARMDREIIQAEIRYRAELEETRARESAERDARAALKPKKSPRKSR